MDGVNPHHDTSATVSLEATESTELEAAAPLMAPCISSAFRPQAASSGSPRGGSHRQNFADALDQNFCCDVADEGACYELLAC
jgi:hypothetical protein